MDQEPNELAWVDEATGLKCCILRNHSDCYCGYVEIPEGHPLHGLDYNDPVPASLSTAAKAVHEAPVGKRGSIDILHAAVNSAYERGLHAGFLFDVHGSVTYSGTIKGEGFWYGFDCSHAGDASPPWSKYARDYGDGIYRDLAYVQAECTSLAKQLAALKEPA